MPGQDNSLLSINIPTLRVSNLISRPLPAATMITIFSILGMSATEGVTDGRFYSTLGLGGLLAVLIWLSSRQDREKSESRIAEVTKDYRTMIQEHTSAIGKLTTVIDRTITDSLETRERQQLIVSMLQDLNRRTSVHSDVLNELSAKVGNHDHAPPGNHNPHTHTHDRGL